MHYEDRPHFERGAHVRLWLDDERPAPEGWTRVFNQFQAIFLMEAAEYEGFVVDMISLDHDLGENAGDGYQVACWMEKQAGMNRRVPDELYCHSANPVGRMRIMQAFDSIQRIRERST
jgi:hypothetical protein